jgi:hypothetical protein
VRWKLGFCLSSNSHSQASTSLGGKKVEDGIFLLSKDLATKIIKEVYEEYKQSSFDLH